MKKLLIAVAVSLIFPAQAFALVFLNEAPPNEALSASEHTATYQLNDTRIQIFSGRTMTALEDLLARFKSLNPNSRFIGGTHAGLLLGCMIPNTAGNPTPQTTPFHCLWAEDQKSTRHYHHVQFSKLPTLESNEPLTFADITLPGGQDHPHLAFSDGGKQNLKWLHITKGKTNNLKTQVESDLKNKGWKNVMASEQATQLGFSHFEKGQESLFIRDTGDSLLLLQQGRAP